MSVHTCQVLLPSPSQLRTRVYRAQSCWLASCSVRTIGRAGQQPLVASDFAEKKSANGLECCHDGLDNLAGRANGIWPVYDVGFRCGVLRGPGPDERIQVRPTLEFLLRSPVSVAGNPANPEKTISQAVTMKSSAPCIEGCWISQSDLPKSKKRPLS